MFVKSAGSAFHQLYIDNAYPDEDFSLFFPIIKCFIYYLFIYLFMFGCPFFSPDDVQSIISGKLALRYSGSQVSKILILL